MRPKHSVGNCCRTWYIYICDESFEINFENLRDRYLQDQKKLTNSDLY